MRLNRICALLALLLLAQASWGAVTFSKDTIECCKLWQSVVTVTKADGQPYAGCKIFISVMETKAGIETTLTKSTYTTDSLGTAVLSYTPSKPAGERLKISISCDENKLEKLIPVTGLADGQTGPGFNFELPRVETWQIAAVAFIVFAAVFIFYGRRLAGIFRLPAGKKAAVKKSDPGEEEMSPRRLILDHERKSAAKLARKHRRKEIRLGHEFVRKL